VEIEMLRAFAFLTRWGFFAPAGDDGLDDRYAALTTRRARFIPRKRRVTLFKAPARRPR